MNLSGGDNAPGVEGLEGIREASVASDGSSPALSAVHHICIAEAAYEHHSCTSNTCQRIATAYQRTLSH